MLLFSRAVFFLVLVGAWLHGFDRFFLVLEFERLIETVLVCPMICFHLPLLLFEVCPELVMGISDGAFSLPNDFLLVFLEVFLFLLVAVGDFVANKLTKFSSCDRVFFVDGFSGGFSSSNSLGAGKEFFQFLVVLYFLVMMLKSTCHL